VLVYIDTKEPFLGDIHNNAIHEKIRREVKWRTESGATESRISAWRNTKQLMTIVLEDKGLTSDVEVSLEYQLPLSCKRIDFILTAQDEELQEMAVINELTPHANNCTTWMCATASKNVARYPSCHEYPVAQTGMHRMCDSRND
jgi:hypothetical protein